MKRMRHANKSGWTKAEKKQAVKKVKTLVKELLINQVKQLLFLKLLLQILNL